MTEGGEDSGSEYEIGRVSIRVLVHIHCFRQRNANLHDLI